MADVKKKVEVEIEVKDKDLKKLDRGFRKFSITLIGVIFFMRLLQRVFMGLFSPVLEVFGVFELFNIMLISLFLPIMEAIFPILLKVVTWFINLSDETKKNIGMFLLILLGATALITIFAVLIRGVATMIDLFAQLVQAGGAAAGWIGAIGVGLATLFAGFLAGGVITDFINDKLLPSIEKLLDKLGLDIDLETIFTGIKDEITDLLGELGISKDDIDDWVEDVKTFMKDMKDKFSLYFSIAVLFVQGLSASFDQLALDITDFIEDSKPLIEFLTKIAEKVKKITENIGFKNTRQLFKAGFSAASTIGGLASPNPFNSEKQDLMQELLKRFERPPLSINIVGNGDEYIIDKIQQWFNGNQSQEISSQVATG